MSLKEETKHEVGWRLANLHRDFRQHQVTGLLFMPTSLPESYKEQWAGQAVRLDVTKSGDTKPDTKPGDTKSDDTIHALTIMRDSGSDNILRAKLVFKSESDILAWVEPYTGNLHDYLLERNLGIPDYLDPKSKFTLPTPNLRSAIRQVIKGLEDLRKSGHYHGGFSLKKTYYVMDASGIVIKLCCFRVKKEGSFHEKLTQDWWAINAGLIEIRNIADKLKRQYPNMDCCQLDGLIAFLRNIGPLYAESAFQSIKRQPFFWGKVERKEFFVNAIPLALSNRDFWSNVDKATFISLPWGGGNKFRGLLVAMNNYKKKTRQDEYDTKSRVDYVKFISGLYTHEFQLETTLKVDSTVQERDPSLCYHLYALMPRANTAGT